MVYTKNKFVTSKVELEIVYKRLGSIKAVADKYGVSKKLILNHIKMHGVKPIQSTHLKGRLYADRIKQLAADGLNGVEIAKAIGTTPETVYGSAKRNGVKIIDTFHKGFTITHAGYVCIYMPDHPNSDGKGYVREHRLVMEKYLGRYLEDDECVHHIDFKKDNNSIANLELMLIEDHTKLHHIGKQGRGPDKKPRKKTLKI